MRAERIHFIEASVARTKPRHSGVKILYDSLSPLGLRINAGGSRTFFIITTTGDRQTVGKFPMPLAEAREPARHAVQNGHGITLSCAEAVERFLEKKAWGKPRTKRDATRILSKHLAPLKRKALSAVTNGDIHAVIDGIRAPSETAVSWRRMTPSHATPSFIRTAAAFGWQSCRTRKSSRPSAASQRRYVTALAMR
jgi:hypothetical protein